MTYQNCKKGKNPQEIVDLQKTQNKNNKERATQITLDDDSSGEDKGTTMTMIIQEQDGNEEYHLSVHTTSGHTNELDNYDFLSLITKCGDCVYVGDCRLVHPPL